MSNANKRDTGTRWDLKPLDRLSAGVHEKPNVLLIDPFAAHRPEHSLLLASEDYIVTTICDYRELFTLARTKVFRVALLSDTLDRLTLRAAAEMVRKQWPRTRIVVLGHAPAVLDDPLYDESLGRPFQAEDLIHLMFRLSDDPWKHKSGAGMNLSFPDMTTHLSRAPIPHVLGVQMALPKVLLVDDDEMVRTTLCKILGQHGFEVTCAGNVREALQYISKETFDVLLSDLHMPGAGDGLTVVSAIRHANPDAVTLLLSAFPEMTAAANAILMQADEILIKPMKIPDLIEVITQRLHKGPLHRRHVESLGAILQRTTQASIDDWYEGVQAEDVLTAIPLTREARCRHLPQLFADLATRLQASKPLGTKELLSDSASTHGVERRQQGYTAAMMVEESRILQVTIFHTLQKNLGSIDFSVLLLGIMTIADEVDSQLSQAMKSYTSESQRQPAAA